MITQFAKERYVSKSLDGPCCSLLVIDYDEFSSSLNELAAFHQNASEDGTSRNSTLVVVSVCGGLKDFLVSQVKYNLPIIEKILEDESDSLSSFWFV